MEEPPVVNPETCPEAAPPDDVCEIEEDGLGTTCVYDDLSCVCVGVRGVAEWQCSVEADPPEAADASAVPSNNDAG
jgi:hypothetical protein